MTSKLSINKTLLALFLLFCGIVVFSLMSVISHGKYYLDGYRLLSSQHTGWFFQGSYESTATFLSPLFNFFMALGYSGVSMQSRIFDFYFVISVFFLITMFMIFFAENRYVYKINLYYLFCMMMLMMNLSVFFATVNKEIVYLFFLFPLVLLQKYIKFSFFLLVFFIITVVYSLGGRYYFSVFAMLTLVLYYFLHQKLKLVFLLFFMVLIGYILFPYVMHIIILAKPYSIQTITNTWIVDFFDKTEYFSFLLNCLVNSLRIMFPVELIVKGPKYIVPIFFLCMLSYMSIKIILMKEMVWNVKNDTRNLNFIYFSAITIISFSFTQSIFEPDFGSVLRHKVAIVFMMISVFNFFSFKEYYLVEGFMRKWKRTVNLSITSSH